MGIDKLIFPMLHLSDKGIGFYHRDSFVYGLLGIPFHLPDSSPTKLYGGIWKQ